MTPYDLLVIGNGSAGDNIARTLGRKGMRVGLVEREHLGGECLNDGCVPSKALVSLASSFEGRLMDWDEVLARVHATELLVRGNDPGGGLSGDGVDLYWGDAVFEAPTVINVGGETLEAKEVVVATGTSPAIPPIAGLADVRPITNRTLFHLPQRPSRLAVIGGGPIGLELGQAIARLGSDVTIFESLPRIAATEDEQVSLELTRLFETEGIRVVVDAAIESVNRDETGMVELTTAQGTHWFDEVLVAAGRSAQIPDGLAGLGLACNGRGYVEIDGCGRTNLPSLWAAGDVTGKFQFTHFAAYQAHHIAKHLEHASCEPIPETVVPWAIFTDPEVGHVGLTEEAAREQGEDISVGYLEAKDLDWFRTTDQRDGFAKVIARASDGRLLGVHLLCANAATVAGEASLAVAHGLTARDVASTIHPYPTASELFRWACARAV